MIQRIKRVPPRNNLCTTNDGEAIKHIRNGTVVVWSYERIRKNFEAESIPYVDVIFRFLDRNDDPAGVTEARIGVSRLGSFRLGTIWQRGKCIAETDLGKDREFSVDFTTGTWSYISIQGNHQPVSYFKNDYPLRSQPTDKVLTEFLSFPISGNKNLLVPCIEFLYRCYGSTSDMARILTTYPWPKVLELLYADTTKNPHSWVVRPQPHVPNDDGLFLAYAQYDEYAENTAKRIYAELDNAHGKRMKETSLRVKPWFQGPAKLKVRGRWINNNNSFLCYEITGMSQPQDHPYEIRRVKYSKEDTEQDETLIDTIRVKVDVSKPTDPFALTDRQEPDQGSAHWSKPDPGFQILHPECPHAVSYEERSLVKKNVNLIPSGAAKMLSTGDPRGYNKDVGKFTAVAKRVLGDGGAVQDVWESLQRLKDNNRISSLAWQSERQGFVQSADLRLLALAAFAHSEAPKGGDRTWLSYKENANRRRGILVARAVIGSRSFYLFELQRKKIRKGTVYGEEKISGLLIEINNDAEALVEISRICCEIRFTKGNFRNLKTPFKHPYVIFRHHPDVGTTIFYAFYHFGILCR
ncbi:hypothetical protein [Pseudomonas sp. MH9.3]|uniref:hypothetical protein n=2 Tax=Pseudomonas sp. MH9.3 TaxID=3048630 RepID=UPI002AC8B4FF|nr:hypothetical protein [Pseudomonas sp. MH9.3]WPX77665.1 hypothetical protein RHM60_15550 [Pseudomonas sp. MH9.3]WQG59583.1 hypothetical protein RHM66_11045 [Pseudomonas sp. RTB3]